MKENTIWIEKYIANTIGYLHFVDVVENFTLKSVDPRTALL